MPRVCFTICANMFFLVSTCCAQIATTGKDLYGDPLPSGAVARLGTLRFHQQNSVAGVAFVANGKQLLVATPDAYLMYYDVASGKRLRKVQIGKGEVNAFAATDDGRRLALTIYGEQDQTANCIVDSDEGKVIQRIAVEERQSGWIAISPNGATIVTAVQGKEFHFWDSATGKLVYSHSLPQPIDVSCASFSPDSKMFTWGSQNFVDWLDWSSGNPAQRLRLGRRVDVHTSSIAVLRDNTTLVVYNPHQHNLLLVDTTKQQVTGQLLGDVRDYEPWLIVFPDGQHVAAYNSQQGICVWNVSRPEIEFELSVPSHGSQIAISPDGNLLTSVHKFSSSMVQLFDLQSQQLLSRWKAHGVAPKFIGFLKDGRRVVTASDDGPLRVWDTKSGKQESELNWSGHTFAISPDAQWLAAVNYDDTIRVWNVETGIEKYRLAGHGWSGIRALQFSTDSQRVASFGDDRYVYVWDLRTGKAIVDNQLTVAAHPWDRTRLGAARFTADDAQLLMVLDQSLEVVDPATGKSSLLAELDGNPMSLLVAPAGDRGFIVQHGPEVGTYSIAKLTLGGPQSLHTVRLPGELRACAISMDGGYLATIDKRDEAFAIRIFRESDTTEIAKIRVLESEPCSIVFAPDNSLIACGLQNGNVLLWDLTSKLQLHE